MLRTRDLWAFSLLVFPFAFSLDPLANDVRTVVRPDSRIEFHASSTFGKINGDFRSWQAELKMPAGKFEDGSLALRVEAASVSTGSHMKDKTVKGKNFFFVTKYPDIRFVSTSIVPDVERHEYQMEGDLTLRGITKPISITVKVLPANEGLQRIDGKFGFNRREFGITHNVPFNRISDTVNVEFNLQVEAPSAGRKPVAILLPPPSWLQPLECSRN